MRSLIFTLTVMLSIGGSAVADLPSWLELVRALRSSGQVETAIQLLDELKTKPGKLNAADQLLIPLEYARCKLEQASHEPEDGRRAILLGQARGEFEAFIKANARHPMAAQANVEIARLLSLQAKAIMSKGNRQEKKEDKALEFSKARPQFEKAVTAYTNAIKELNARIKEVGSGPLAIELERTQAQAELDKAITVYNIGASFIADDERTQRGKKMDEAQKEFDKLSRSYEKKRVGFVAAVWSIQCQYENGLQADGAKAMSAFERANQSNVEAAEAIRLARYHGIQHTYELGSYEPSVKETPAQQFARTELAATRWLAMYNEFRRTGEGLGARYRLALMKEQQARLPGNITYDDKTRRVKSMNGTARQKLTEANVLYRDLAEFDNEYSDRAMRRRLLNQVAMLDAEGRGDDPPIRTIVSLEQGYLAAQVQYARISEARDRLMGKAEPKKAPVVEPKKGTTPPKKVDEPTVMTPELFDKEEKRRLRSAIAYLERGLMLQSSKDTPRDIFDAQLMLARTLQQTERAPEAAVLGEAMARGNPRMPKAAVAAQIAVYSYNTAFGKLAPQERNEASGKADLNRLKELAKYADKTWPNEAATDAIRHVFAFFLNNRDKDFQQAWEVYNRISTGYSEVYQARREQGIALFMLIRPEERDIRKFREGVQKNITQRAAQWQTTLAALEGLPVPPNNVEADDAESYVGAKVQLAQLYLLASDYVKAEAIAAATEKTAKELTSFSDDKRLEMVCMSRSMLLAALAGRAGDAMREKEYGKALLTIDPQLAVIKAELDKPAPQTTSNSYTTMLARRRDLLILGMTAAVQDKKGDKATEILEVLRKSGGGADDTLNVLRQMVVSIRGRIEALKAEKKEDDAKELGAAFSEFLDKLGSDPDKLSNQMLSFMVQGLSAVGSHAKAVELIDKGLSRAKDPKMAAEDHDRFQLNMKFLKARELRLTGGDDKYTAAAAILKELIGEPLDPKATRGKGYSNLEMRRELCMLHEDRKAFGLAIQQWTKLQRDFVPQLPPKPKEAAGNVNAQKASAQRRMYFDFYYEVYRCSARGYAAQDPAKFKGGQDALNEKLAGIGEKFFNLTKSNDDLDPELVEKINRLMDQYPKAGERFNKMKKEAEAAAPKT